MFATAYVTILLQRSKLSSMEEVAESVDVSPGTAGRDLREMEAAGLVDRLPLEEHEPIWWVPTPQMPAEMTAKEVVNHVISNSTEGGEDGD